MDRERTDGGAHGRAQPYRRWAKNHLQETPRRTWARFVGGGGRERQGGDRIGVQIQNSVQRMHPPNQGLQNDGWAGVTMRNQLEVQPGVVHYGL